MLYSLAVRHPNAKHTKTQETPFTFLVCPKLPLHTVPSVSILLKHLLYTQNRWVLQGDLEVGAQYATFKLQQIKLQLKTRSN